MEQGSPSKNESPSEKEDDEVIENPDEFKQSKFGTRKVTEVLLQRYKGLTSEGNEIWNQMPELKYQVTKINQYGKRQPRTLKLSSVGIENIRKNGKVSSVHGYEEVKKVTMKNLKTFVIKYEGAKHDYQYRSPVAMYIVQEITSRLSIKRQISRPTPELKVDIAQKHQEKLQRSGQLDRMIKKPSMREVGEEERKSMQAKKLQMLLGASEEQRLETAVDSITLDTSTTEGRTLKQFCNNFSVLEQNPATLVMNVRQFIDDLRAYIMEKHYKELSKLLVEASSKSFTPEDLSLSSVIERSLEKAIVSRFQGRIVSCLKRPSKEEEMNLRRNILKAQEKSQEFFGIKPHFTSDSDWADAVYELKLINDFDLPSQQLATILAAAKAIYSTFNCEKNKGKGRDQRKSYFLTADDFFPIFLYVVVHSDVRNPQVLTEYLWNLCDPEQLNGEGGYYLTVFCSALEYLKNAFENDNTVDDPLLGSPSESSSSTAQIQSHNGGSSAHQSLMFIKKSFSKHGGTTSAGSGHGNSSSSASLSNLELLRHTASERPLRTTGARSPTPTFPSSPVSPSSAPSAPSSWNPSSSDGSLTPGSSFRLTYCSSADNLAAESTPPSSPRKKFSAKRTKLKRTSSLPTCRTSPESTIVGGSQIIGSGLSSSDFGDGSEAGFGSKMSLMRTTSVMLLKSGVERLKRLRSGGEIHHPRATQSTTHPDAAAPEGQPPVESQHQQQNNNHNNNDAEHEDDEQVGWRSCKPSGQEKETAAFI